MEDRHRLRLAELHKQTESLIRAGRVLQRSHTAFQQIGVKDQYTDDELDVVDAYTSRFARATDLLTQRLLPMLDILELLEPGSLIDRLNRAERRAVISSAEQFREIRLLRNDISHEYAREDFRSLLEAVVGYSPAIVEAITAVQHYVTLHYPDE
jgi:hypothetical protein